jgi:hypothetical protein
LYLKIGDSHVDQFATAEMAAASASIQRHFRTICLINSEAGGQGFDCCVIDNNDNTNNKLSTLIHVVLCCT